MLAEYLPFEGIVHQLRNENKNIREYIQIETPRNAFSTEYDPYNLFEFDNEGDRLSYFHNLNITQETDDNWIQFNFKETKYILFAMTIRTNYFGECYSHPKKFEILGSNDNENWTTIFTSTKDPDLNGAGKYYVCKIENNKKSYQYIRFKQKDSYSTYKDHYGIMALSAIEFFGDLSIND